MQVTKPSTASKAAKQKESQGDESRTKALESVLKEIESSYGKGSMIRLGMHLRILYQQIAYLVFFMFYCAFSLRSQIYPCIWVSDIVLDI